MLPISLKRNLLLSLIIILNVLFLAACGSSSSDDDGGSANTPEQEALAVFETNRSSENLDNWVEHYWEGSVNFEANGTTVSINADGFDGTEAWSILRGQFDNAIGMLITLNVSDQNEMGGPGVGIREYFGLLANGNRIRIDLSTSAGDNGGQKAIKYTVREKDSDGETITVFAEGNLGESDGMWSLGQDFTIGFARFDNALWCYNDGQVKKVYTIGDNVTLSSEGLDITAWANGWGYDFIEATGKNVKIIYPDD